jgi:hypothetical protein
VTDQEHGKKRALKPQIEVKNLEEFWGNPDGTPLLSFAPPLLYELCNLRTLTWRLNLLTEEQQSNALYSIWVKLLQMRVINAPVPSSELKLFAPPSFRQIRHKKEYSEPRLRDKRLQH